MRIEVPPVIKWFLSAELFSLILILILTLNYYERRWKDYPRRRLYHLCLLTSAASILLNILCVYTISRAWDMPLWINLLCNSAYFLLIVTVSTIIAYYLMYLLFEHIYQRSGLLKFRRILLALYGFYFLLLVYNLPSGIIFYFDQNRVYHRGPLINSGYGVMAIQLLLLVVFTLRNHDSISHSMRRVMRLLPPVVLLLTAYQLLYPDVLFNGGIIVAANIILLVNFQSRRIEQDTLTSSGNRNSFHQELSLRLGGQQHFQIIVIAIHQFGTVNCSYGHKTGDALLYEIARWLETVSSSGNSFRIGNVEFALLVPYKGIVSSEKLIDTVYRRFQEPWIIGDMNVVLDTSFAELIYTDQDWNATNILEFLNFSLSLAKEAENHMIRFDEDTYRKMEQRNQIIQRMQQCEKESLFQVWYQPIYNCRTGTFDMAEALIRMKDQDGKQIPPGLFVPLAEQHGLISEISFAVFQNACRLLSSIPAEMLSSVSVNLSMQQFMSNDLISDIENLLNQYSFDPGRLKLEVTERVLSEDIPHMRQVMTELNRRGICFSLDDFGTGYSNLSVVLDCSFACIKLDRSLIRGYTDNERSSSIVNTMLELFHHMNCQVIAEGVETAEQADALIRQGADWIQGYYYARPMPEDEFLAFLRSEAARIPS